MVNVLAAEELIRSPKLYAIFLLWMLSELFERLPEVGDPDKPTLVFFFDEAHLLFSDAPPALIEKIEQVVRLIRSKGVGIYFVTQSPADVPDTVLGQLGNRVQHALRAFTPRDQKAGEDRRRYTAAQPQGRHRAGDQRAGGRRGAGVDARCQGQPDRDRAGVDRASGVPHRPNHRRRMHGRTRADPVALRPLRSRRSIASRRSRNLGRERLERRDRPEGRDRQEPSARQGHRPVPRSPIRCRPSSSVPPDRAADTTMVSFSRRPRVLRDRSAPASAARFFGAR